MKHTALAGLFLTMTLSLQAAESNSSDRTIQVMGEGEVKVEPDEVGISFQIESFGRELKQLQKDNAARTATVMETLNKLGVAGKDVQTSHAQIHPRYDFDKGKRKFREFVAMKSFNAKIRDIANYGAVLNGLLEAGVENVGGVQFSSSRMKQLKDEARKLAAADAKAKAEVLAGPLGAKVGKPITISEETIGGPIQPVRALSNAAMGMAMAESAMPEDTVAAGEISVKTTVNVQFELQ